MLQCKGYEVFLPTYRKRRIWSDRVKELDIPLFAGYLFCRFDLSDRTALVLTVPGVKSILGIGGKPVPVEEKELGAVRRVMATNFSVVPWQAFQPGQAIRVIKGPLAGIEGSLISLKNQHKIILTVSMLQRSVAVQIDTACCVPV